jgi:hypothetical protein
MLEVLLVKEVSTISSGSVRLPRQRFDAEYFSRLAGLAGLLIGETILFLMFCWTYLKVSFFHPTTHQHFRTFSYPFRERILICR